MPRAKPRATNSEQRERDMERGLEERAEQGTFFVDLILKYSIPKSTLCNRSRGMQTRQKSHEAYQALTPALGKALDKWALQMNVQGFRRDWI